MVQALSVPDSSYHSVHYSQDEMKNAILSLLDYILDHIVHLYAKEIINLFVFLYKNRP